MPHTTKDIFIKCWIWAVIGSIATAALFWFLSSIGNMFHWEYGGTVFMDLLLIAAIAGSYLGAGYIGWRIVCKYYSNTTEYFLKQYRQYSIVSFIALVVIVYSPLSILAFLWSVLAPGCVLASLSKARKLTRDLIPYQIPVDW